MVASVWTIQDAAEYVDHLAVEALLDEVAATPKPGLVDCRNSGAHADMDIHTFAASAQALRGFFGECFASGAAHQARPARQALERLRALGLRAEEDMFAATGGVNTHKGAIFSLGMLCGAAGLVFGKAPLDAWQVCGAASRLCGGLCEDAFAAAKAKAPDQLTHGERVYLTYGAKGARGEAEAGFPTVTGLSLPVYGRLLQEGVPPGDALVETLLCLIARTVDTNILARRGQEAASFARQAAERCLQQGGYLREGGFARVAALDEAFIRRGISPGGSADLLAITHFLHALQRTRCKARNAEGERI